MKRMVPTIVLLTAVSCTHAVSRVEPSPAAVSTAGLGLCPTPLGVALPDTTTPLKVAPTCVRWAGNGFQPAFGPIFGRVVIRMSIDTLGHVEPGSMVVTQSDNPELAGALCDDLLHQRFVPYRAGDETRRVRVEREFRFGNAPRH